VSKILFKTSVTHGGTILKHILVFLLPALVGLGLAHAQDQSYKVVFDLTSRDSLDQKAVMRWISEITASNPKAELEVVMYGKGFELVMPEKSTVISELQTAMKNPHVSFRVCEGALKINKVDKSQLVKEVQTVPDGICELVLKQHQGWGYIKVGH
jgi:intracellular sulfur oxidation DsrE/DsrF family protein